jgi:hypothetical protein
MTRQKRSTKGGPTTTTKKPSTKDVQNVPKSIYSKHPNNVHLFRFSNCELDDESLHDAIEQFLQKKALPQGLRSGFVHILLQSNQLTDRSSHHVAKLLQNLNNKKSNDSFHVKELNLSGNQIQGNMLHVILDQHFSFSEINLSWNNLGMRAMQSIAHFLKNGRIEMLNLNKNEIGHHPGALTYLCRNGLLPKCTLQSLLLKENGIQGKFRLYTPREIVMPDENAEIDDVMSLCAVIINKNCSLTELNLSNNELKDDGIALIALALKNNTSLTSLNVAHNQFGVKGFRVMGESLGINQTLQHINLSCDLNFRAPNLVDSKLGISDYDECLFAVSRALCKNNTLQSLSLLLDEGYEREEIYSSNKMLCSTPGERQYGLEWLFKSLRTNHALKQLDIRHTFISDRTAAKILRVLETCNSTLINVLFSSINTSIAGQIQRKLIQNRESVRILEQDTKCIEPISKYHEFYVPKRKYNESVQEPTDGTCSSFHILPTEILIAIVCFLPTKWVSRIRLVDTLFNTIATDAQVWANKFTQYPNYLVHATDRSMEEFKRLWMFDTFSHHGSAVSENMLQVEDLTFHSAKLKRQSVICCYSRIYGVVAMLEVSPHAIHDFDLILGIHGTNISSDRWKIYAHGDFVYVDASASFTSGENSPLFYTSSVSKAFYTSKTRWIKEWVKFIETYRWKRTKLGNGAIKTSN